jgi:MoxR-like ATPase
VALARTAQALAATQGRDYVLPDDVKKVACPVMAHRLIPHPEMRLSGFSTERLVEELLHSIPVERK